MTTRREKVLLELEDHFTSGMVRAAAATELLDKNLDHLSDSAVQTSREAEKTKTSVKGLGDEVERTGVKVDKGNKDIDRFSGRLRLLGEAAAFLGPALVPIGAVAVPAVVGLAAGLGAAAGAAGVAVLAFHGIGDALKALDDYQLDPTTAHLEKMRQEFEKIGPTGVAMVKFLDDLEPQLKDLQTVARAGLFPGVEAGITSLLDMLPEVRVLLFNLSTELGHLTAEAGKAMSGAGAKAFFDYLERDAAPTMAAFAHTLGNLAQGFGSLMMAFSPLSRDFASGMESMSHSFEKWAAGLSKTDGFRSFVAYVRESGPQVLALLGSLATAFIDIAQAAAPVGRVVLPALTTLAKVLSLIAESPIGPPLFTASVAMLALARATTIANGAMLKFSGTSAAATKNLALVGAGLNFAAILAGIYAVDTAMDKVFGDRSVDGGNLIKNLTDLTSSDAVDQLDKIGVSIKNINSSMLQGEDKAFGFLPGDTTWGEARDNIEKVDQALAQMVASGNGEQAAAAMDKIVASAKEQGISTAEATKWFKLYNAAVADSPKASDAAADSARKLAKAHNQQAASADDAAASTAALVGAMQDEATAALKAFDAETQYREALKAAAAQAKKNDAGIRGNSKAVLENRGAISQLAAAWNNQSGAVKNNVGRFREARQAFIDAATGMGVAEGKAKALADRMLQIPKSIVIKQQNNMDPAVRTAKLLAAAVRNIPRTWLTEYTINTVRTGTKPELHAPAGADGMTVPGTRHPYGDKTLILAAPGEEVISNRHGQADQFRADRASGRIPRYAEGGQVGGAPTSWAAWQASKSRDPFAGLGDAAQQAGINLAAFNKIGLKELKQRDHFLNWQEKQAQKAEQQAEKLLSVQRDRLAEERSQLQDLKDARAEFAKSVSANFKSSLFGNTDLSQAASSGLLGQDFKDSVWAYADQQRMDAFNNGTAAPDQASFQDWAQSYLETLSQTQLTALQVTANSNQLQQDTTQSGAFSYLLGQLRDMGLTGGAYRELAQSGNLDQAQAYANLSPEEIAQLVKDYRARNQANKRLENRVGDAEYGKQIAQQTRAVERQARLTHDMADHVREMKDAIHDQTRLDHQIEQRVGELVKLEQKRKAEAAELAKKTGQEVGAVINNAVTHGRQKG